MSGGAHNSRAVPERARPIEQAVGPHNGKQAAGLWRDFLKNPFAWALLGFSALSLLLSLLLLPKTDVLTCEDGVWVGVEYPRTLSSGDEGRLRLTVQNRVASPLTGTLSLHFLGPLPVQVGEGEVTRLEVKDLPSEASVGFAVSFQMHAPLLLFRSGAVNFSIRWTAADKTALCRTPQGVEVLRISLAPLHGLQGLSR
ncbi:MAG: hypothetical protein ACK4WK_08550, partial [Anaerolineae bacterium]